MNRYVRTRLNRADWGLIGWRFLWCPGTGFHPRFLRRPEGDGYVLFLCNPFETRSWRYIYIYLSLVRAPARHQFACADGTSATINLVEISSVYGNSVAGDVLGTTKELITPNGWLAKPYVKTICLVETRRSALPLATEAPPLWWMELWTEKTAQHIRSISMNWTCWKKVSAIIESVVPIWRRSKGYGFSRWEDSSRRQNFVPTQCHIRLPHHIPRLHLLPFYNQSSSMADCNFPSW